MIDPEDYKLHIFDLDDTLVNTSYSYTIAQESAIRDTFPQIPSDAITALLPVLKWMCRQFGSGNISEYMSAFLKSRPDLFAVDSDILELILDRYKCSFNTEFKCFNGAISYIQYLKKTDKKLALVSNGIVASQFEKLRTTGLDSFFPAPLCYISGAYPSNFKKPSPHMLEQACQYVGVSPPEVVFYGNSVGDILAGNLAGVTTVHFSESTPIPGDLPAIARPDYTIENWTELMDFKKG
ncbi:HAD hydrolase-like protein [bacterium]|nr:HAD hydrolase-like protein [bacterium]